jgi:hypothetical protein
VWPVTSFLLLLLLLLRLLYSLMWTFASLMDLIQSSLFFDLCSQFLFLHLIISPYTQSHHLDLCLAYLLADFLEVMRDFKFSRRRVWSSELSSVMYCRVRGTCCLHHQGWDLWNVGRQLFYTAVHPRRQFWTSLRLISKNSFHHSFIVHSINMTNPS